MRRETVKSREGGEGLVAAPIPPYEPAYRAGLSRSSWPTRATFSRSSASALGSAVNQASRISLSSGSDVSRRLSASTLASFQRRAPSAV